MREHAYFDHEADVGVLGRGTTLEEAFEAAAEATFAVMGDVRAARPLEELDLSFEEPDQELALVRWLNGLLAEARARTLMLCEFHLRREGSRWSGRARGEPWSDRLERGVEVKGATLTALSVRSLDDGWEAGCVVDV